MSFGNILLKIVLIAGILGLTEGNLPDFHFSGALNVYHEASAARSQDEINTFISLLNTTLCNLPSQLNSTLSEVLEKLTSNPINIQSIKNGFLSKLKSTANGMISVLAYAVGGIKTVANTISAKVNSTANDAISKLNSSAGEIKTIVRRIPTKINSTVKGVISHFNSTLEGIKITADRIPTKINSTIKGVISQLNSTLESVKTVAEEIPTKLDSTFNEVAGKVNQTGGDVSTKINSTLENLPSIISLISLIENLTSIPILKPGDPGKVSPFMEKPMQKLGKGGCNKPDPLLIANLPSIFIVVPLVIVAISVMVGAIAAAVVAIGGLGERITHQIYTETDFENIFNSDMEHTNGESSPVSITESYSNSRLANSDQVELFYSNLNKAHEKYFTVTV